MGLRHGEGRGQRGQISVYLDYWETADQAPEEGPKALIINTVKFKAVLAENLAWL